MTIRDCTIHASSSKHPYDGYALVLNLTGFTYGYRDLVTATAAAQRLIPKFYRHVAANPTPKHPVVTIDWPDGGIPDFTKADWIRLLQDLSKIKGKVLVHCMGGHGRTGTALAALLFLSQAVKGDTAKWVREYFCEKVIESESQITYLKSLGIPVKIEPRYMTPSTYQYFGSSFTQEEYELTKPKQQSQKHVDEKLEIQPLYECILCHRKHIAASFYQTFMDMSGFCWSCHQLTHKTSGDELQSS